MKTPAHRAADLTEFLIFFLTTNTQKYRSEAIFGILGKEKLKFTKKTLPAKNVKFRFPITPCVCSIFILSYLYEANLAKFIFNMLFYLCFLPCFWAGTPYHH